MRVTCTAIPTMREQTVLFVSDLLHVERLRRGTRTGTRALSCFKQAVLVLRWFLGGTRISRPATDNAISRSTASASSHEGLSVLAAHAPTLHSALLAATTAGYSPLAPDGTPVETDRCRTPGPTPGGDLWWSGKHPHPGGNIPVITAPDGWPLGTSPVRPGREHDTTALRQHPEILPALATGTHDHQRRLGDPGYEGEAGTTTVAFKKPAQGQLTDTQRTYNKVHNDLRALAERGNPPLTTTLKARRHLSLRPWTIGDMAAAALVLPHLEHDRII
jgi:DDE superfamily endonuclease